MREKTILFSNKTVDIMDQVFMNAAKKILLHILKLFFKDIKKKVAYDLTDLEKQMESQIQQEIGFVYHSYMGKLYELL